MWQSHVENEHYSYHILTTTSYMIVTLLWNLPESSTLVTSIYLLRVLAIIQVREQWMVNNPLMANLDMARACLCVQ